MRKVLYPTANSSSRNLGLLLQYRSLLQSIQFPHIVTHSDKSTPKLDAASAAGWSCLTLNGWCCCCQVPQGRQHDVV
jgi:hypothetical protein